MNTTQEKILRLTKLFTKESTPEDRYKMIIDLGKTLKSYPDSLKTPAFTVPGCQSILYLSSSFENGRLIFTAYSEALISAGLAALLIEVYSNESPQTILMTSPIFLKDLGVLGSLTPSRSNGLAQIHVRMKKDALINLKSLNTEVLG